MPMSPYLAEIRELVGDRLLLIPSVSAYVFDDRDRLLLVHQAREGVWSTPGGAIEPGERPATACVREVREETGLTVEVRDLIGVLGGDGSEVIYANGDRVSYVSVMFHCGVLDGSPEPDHVEVDAVRWFSPGDLDELQSPPLQRLLLREAVAWWADEDRRPRFRPPMA